MLSYTFRKHCVRPSGSTVSGDEETGIGIPALSFGLVDVAVDSPHYAVVVLPAVQRSVDHQPHGQVGISGLVGRLAVFVVPKHEAVPLVEADASSGHVFFRFFHLQHDGLVQ